MKKFFSAALMSLLCSAAMAENIQTVVYTCTPKMVCEKCEKKIKDSLRFIKGTKKIETSLKEQTIAVTYDADKAKTEQYEAALKKLGREVKVVKQEAKEEEKK